MPRPRKPASPFKYFNSSPEVIRLVVMMYVRFPLSLRNVEDLLFERGIDICHETVRLWWNRFGPMFAADIRRQRVSRMRGFRHWKWHLDEVYVKINGEMHYLWRAVDHEGEVLESYVTKTRDKKAALTFMIDRSPEVDHLTIELHVHLVEMPLPVSKPSHPAHSLPPNVSCEQRPEPVPPVPHRLMADVDPALEQQVLYVP